MKWKTLGLFVGLLIISSCNSKEIEEKEEVVEAKIFVAWVKQDGQYGYIRENGDTLILPQYDKVTAFSQGKACVKIDDYKEKAIDGVKGGKYVFINLKNEKQFRGSSFSKLTQFYNDYALIVTSKRKKGMINEQGEIVLKGFDSLEAFYDKSNLAYGKKKKEQGYVDSTGNWVIKRPKGEFCGNFYNGLACVSSKESFGFIDKNGAYAIPPNLQVAADFVEGRAAFLYKGKYGFINRAGKILINPEYEDVFDFNEGLCVAQHHGNWGAIDSMGRVVIDFKFEMLRKFHDGRAAVLINDAMGFIDQKGELVIPATYKEVLDFKNGLAAVRKENEFGYINRAGEVVIPFQFEKAGSFVDPHVSNLM